MTDRGEPWVPYERWHVTRYVKAPIGTERYDVFTYNGGEWIALSSQDGQNGVTAAPHPEVIYPIRGHK